MSALILNTACTKPEPDKPAEDKPAPTESKSSTPSSPAVKPPLPATSQPTTDSRPVADTGAVVGTVHVPSGTAMHDLAAALDNLQPGTSPEPRDS